ncbi:MAG: cupin domain-containing protein [Myxococcota bacterium]
MSGSAPLGLSALFAPLSDRDFLERHWPHIGLVQHGDPEPWTSLTAEPRLASPLALAQVHAGPIQTLGTTDEGGHAQREVAREQVPTLVEQGKSLKFDGVDRTIEEVDRMCEALASDLGLERSTCYCQAFLSGKGERVALHFDSVEVFVLQLRGRKRWTHARNDEVRFPLNPWAPGVQSSPDHGIVAPDGFDPDVDTESAVLRPGSAMFVPRGWWHGTEALDDDCVSLSFMVHTPTWIEVGLAALRKRLMASEAWRRPIAHDLSKASGLLEFVNEAQGMVDRAQQLAGQLAAMDLAPRRPRQLHADMQLQLRPDTTLETFVEDGRVVACITRPGVKRRIAVGPKGAALCRFIVEQPGPFSVSRARDAVSELDADRILLALIRLGALQPS